MNEQRHAILFNDAQLGPYPLEKLKRVDEPTTKFNNDYKRVGTDETSEAKLAKGEYGETVQKASEDFIDKEPIFRAFFDINSHVTNYVLDPAAENKADLPSDPRVLTRHIKKLCYFLGAEVVGITELTEDVLYSYNELGPIEKNYKYAIVMGLSKHRPTVNASYGCEWIDDAVSMQAYQRLGCISSTLANYLRKLGYPAETNVVPKYTAIMPRLILRAGLGEFSRLGIIVNPFLGALAKYAAVFTDFPLELDKPIDFGLQDYCEHCHICADQCMSGAVPYGGKEMHNGGYSWVLNAKPCAMFNMMNPVGKVCERCARSCPWNHIDTDPKQFEDWDGDIKKLHDMADKQAAFMKEHDYVHPSEEDSKWWLPLRYNYEEKRYCETKEFDYKQHEARMKRLKKKFPEEYND